MSTKDDLAAFVQSALQRGKSRDEISEVLGTAGWSRAEIEAALAAWADVGFDEPVPRPRPVISARDFFIYVLTFAALVTAAFNLVFLLFDVIDLVFEDQSHPSHLYRSMRNNIAALIVSAPLLVWLTLREGKKERDDPGRRRSLIRSWLTNLTLLISALVFMGNLIWVVSTFLNGDLTIVFALRMLVIGVVAAGLFLYYWQDDKAPTQ